MALITGPLFKCFGSKWLSSRLLPPPERGLICEPFAGGAGYALRHYEKNVLLFEKDQYVHDLWVWLIKTATQQLIMDIPIGLPIGTDIRTLGLSWGQQLLLKNWQRTNNFGNCWTISSWGHLPGMWTANCRARIAEQHQGVRHWDIRYRSGVDAIISNATPRAEQNVTWLIDPPYEFNYQYLQRRPLDYKGLGRYVRALPGQIIVCEAAHPKTGEFPQWLPFEPWAKRITSRRKPENNKYSSELLWTNTQPLLGSNA